MTLFDVPEVAYARHSDPETSHLAAATASKGLTETQQRVLSVIRIQGGDIGLTDEEIAERFRDYWPDSKVTDQSLRSRRKELEKVHHLVRFSGHYGVTSHGGKTQRWCKA